MHSFFLDSDAGCCQCQSLYMFSSFDLFYFRVPLAAAAVENDMVSEEKVRKKRKEKRTVLVVVVVPYIHLVETLRENLTKMKLFRV